ncbi:hypothetical protein ABTY59_20505 [Streptomyces sp. NPDC096079]|uniref:hypothetical protein n=1 Tax=unclassified Streptomyces TaxID=2593676 RepID=UPI0033252EB4
MTLVVAAALTAAGCTEKEQQYATPSKLCGVPVDPAVLRPVLLPGQKLTASPASSYGETHVCRVAVDDKPVLTLESRPAPADENYRATWDWKMPRATTVNVGGEGRAIDVYVAAAQKCALKGEPRVFLASAERFHPEKDDASARKAALVRFMTAYFPAAQKASGCAT